MGYYEEITIKPAKNGYVVGYYSKSESMTGGTYDMVDHEHHEVVFEGEHSIGRALDKVKEIMEMNMEHSHDDNTHKGMKSHSY